MDDLNQLEELINSGCVSEIAEPQRLAKELSSSPLEPRKLTPVKPICVDTSMAAQKQELSHSNPSVFSQALGSSNVQSSHDSVHQNLVVADDTLVPTRASGFDFKDPVEMLLFLDDDLVAGKINGGYDLHQWQIQFMIDFANEYHTKDSPFRAVVQACNGSGKDKFIVATCSVWLCMRYMYAMATCTNGSGNQLDTQTEPAIRWLCERINQMMGAPVWKCNYRHYTCLATASPIELFATDEPGKAEGYHPQRPGGVFAIFTSESKSIPDEIFTALSRCHGFTHRIDVSSPGNIMGYFYDRCATGIDRKNIKDIKSLPSTDVIKYVVTAYDCPHISESEIERMASELVGGKSSAAFRSSILSEFGTTDEMVVIPYTYIWRAYNDATTWIRESFNKAGLDLSDGGDETVLCIRNGNKLLKVIPFRFDNTEDTVSFLQEQFHEWELNKPEARIYADCGGLGKPILDRLKRLGWANIFYFDNRAKAYQSKTYKNRGAESWFHLGLLFQRHELIIYRDDKLVKQLSTRYYKIIDGRIHQLLSKIESRAKGYPSPDRADALVLAFCDYKSTFVEVRSDEKKPFTSTVTAKPQHDFTLQEWSKRSEFPEKWKPRRRSEEELATLREEILQMNQNRRIR